MENIQSNNGGGYGGADAFARTADALVGAADSLALEFQRRESAEVEARKKDEAQRAELRQKLVSIHEKIGTLLGVADAGGATSSKKRGRPPGSKNKPAESQRGRAMEPATVKAKEKVLAFITANNEMSRGDIAKNCKLDPALVGRVLHMLHEEGAAKLRGSRRGGRWSGK